HYVRDRGRTLTAGLTNRSSGRERKRKHDRRFEDNDGRAPLLGRPGIVRGSRPADFRPFTRVREVFFSGAFGPMLGAVSHSSDPHARRFMKVEHFASVGTPRVFVIHENDGWVAPVRHEFALLALPLTNTFLHVSLLPR